jgi:hypothetical protein
MDLFYSQLPNQNKFCISCNSMFKIKRWICFCLNNSGKGFLFRKALFQLFCFIRLLFSFLLTYLREITLLEYFYSHNILLKNRVKNLFCFIRLLFSFLLTYLREITLLEYFCSHTILLQNHVKNYFCK